ncbi:hypothetical protein SAMN04488503_1328 [Humidesulfovibrio mexicanus]|uniref:Uncharacterized protein n=1 Tax=Humidesulfovibrio mexicanus TaxID=147047 RepID=A0A238Z833_9BACT|nr:hypothetical protein [Humidesulfovibrio mexicanus]SNR79507.1 hypothetical protein SAMN04488503_1328 [Humidesulfovibrio mexicanus]
MTFARGIRRLIPAVLALTLLVPTAAQAGGRGASMNTGGKSAAELSASGARTLSKTEVLDFIAERKGHLVGSFGFLRDSLHLYDDGTVKGESANAMHGAMAGRGSWSVDEDGTLHLSVTWRYGDKLDATGRLMDFGGMLYQVDTANPERTSVYQLKK